MRLMCRFSVLLSLLLTVAVSLARGETMGPRTFIAREGKGYLERVGTQLVLHLKGTPAEMGRQHGVLLKDHIGQSLSTLEKKAQSAGALGMFLFDGIWQKQLTYLPPRYVEELRAMADGAGLPFDLVRRANTIPELFHCSGFAVFKGATRNGNLYHGRILDYSIDEGLQDHAVVILAKPKGYIPFVNVGYAGFLGSVTGMNLKGVAFGEMGGGGQGKWEGTPMSFLMRRGLEEAGSLKKAKAIFRDSKRTCEYYYVISDCKIPSAVGVAATPEKIEFVGPNEVREPLNVPIKDTVVMSANDRYALLTRRVKEKWGSLDAAACLELMRRPVAMSHCLHCALMSPKTRELWVAHATGSGEPASEQPYTYLNIGELMRREPPK